MTNWVWEEKDFRGDGSGWIKHNQTGLLVKVVVQDLITSKRRIALLDGRQIASAQRFTTLLKRIEAAIDAIPAHD